MVDYATWWSEAIALSCLTAKATCKALLEIFSLIGIPKVIFSDHGSNFIAQLTQELEKRLGGTPRFYTPRYQQTNGLVQCWKGVLKSMLRSEGA